MQTSDPSQIRLYELGYKQELKRELSSFKLFAITMSTMTVFTGIIPYYGESLKFGGTIGIIWGWWIAVFFVHFIGLALSEICSSLPTTGSLYYWAASLGGPVYGPFASWMTCWLNYTAVVAEVGSQAYAGAVMLQYIIVICTGGVNGGGYFLSNAQILGISAITIIICAIMNSCSVKLVGQMQVFSVWWQVVGAVALIIVLPMVTPKKQSVKFVFTTWETNQDQTGLPNGVYSWIGCHLLAQYALFGFDSAAHMTEETKNADRTGPLAIMSSISFFSVFGWITLLAITFCIKDYNSVLFGEGTVTAGGYPAVQIIWDAFIDRYDNATGAVVFLGMIFFSFFFGCLANLMSCARVMYAFSRDGGLPLSSLWRRLDKNKVPVYGVWASALVAFVVVLPTLGNQVVFFALTSITTVGWVGSYAAPIFFRIVNPEDTFSPGPFYLRNYVGQTAGKLIHVVALLYIFYLMVVFLLPLEYPITLSNFNYAPVGMLGVVAIFMGWWLLDAHKWFKGPVREVAEIMELAKGDEKEEHLAQVGQ